MKIEKIAIAQLVDDPSNARKHPERNLRAIKGSLARFGQQKPIVVDAKNVVVAGNGTLEAARQLGWTEIDVVRTNLDGIDKTAFALADNRTSELAEWDEEILLPLLEDIDFDIGEIGFDLSEFETPQFEPNLPDEEKTDVADLKKIIIIECRNSKEFEELFAELNKRGLKIKAKM